MAEDKSERPMPKRGAFPTPKHILDKATPYKPDNSGQPDNSDKPPKPDSTVDPSDPESDDSPSSCE